MKRSQQPTEYIFIKVRTNSEWDDCEFAIIHITQEWLQTMRDRLCAIQPFTNDIYFHKHTYWDMPCGFYDSPDDMDINGLSDSVLNAGEDFAFITLDENELENLPVPQSTLDSYQLQIYNSGKIKYTALGKHTEEEFWTADLDLKFLGLDLIGTEINTEEKTKEFITENNHGGWICICGDSECFDWCDKEGNEMEPLIDSDWDDLYVCSGCGRIIKGETLEVVGSRKQ
jgi:hypothetical protein